MAPLLALGASLLPNVVGLFTGSAQRRRAREAAQQAEQRFQQAEGYAQKGLNLAQNQYNLARQNYNGRMAGAGNLEQSIYGNQANTLSALGRNATNASQLLSFAGSVQGNTNDAFGNLAQMEAQDKQARFGQMAYANQGVQAQQNNLANLYQQQSQQAQNSANQNGQASQINSFNALQGIANTGLAAGMGYFRNLFGGGQPSGVTQGALGAGAINPTPFNMYGGMKQPTLNLTLPGIKR